MPRFPTRPALALLGALLCLAACTPTARPATVGRAPTATPARVPAGWKVLTAPHYSLAYPPDWTLDPLADEQESIVWAPAKQGAVLVWAFPRADLTQSSPSDVQLYCQPESYGARHTTFANLPMTFQLTGQGNTARMWRFENAQRTTYLLSAGADAGADAATQAQHEAILATFRPDNATPWSC